jgi:hypothetical protein
MRGKSKYLVPIDVADGSSPAEAPHGTYTLTASHTYVYILPTQDTSFSSIDLQGIDAALVITSATVQDTNHPGSQQSPTAGDLPDTDTTVGGWKNERPTTGYVAVDGTGWSVGTAATACVVAAAGGNVGGALWHIAETGAARTRLLVVVGATGGKARVSGAGKGV